MPKTKRTRATPARSPARVPKALQGLLPAVAAALSELNVQQRQFVINYCGRARGNGTLAAQLSGYKGSYATLGATASRILLDPKVRAARDAWMEGYGINGIQTTAMIADLAEANIGPFMKLEGGVLKMRDDIDEETWEAYKHWVQEVELDPKTHKAVRVKVHSRMRALDLLARINKLTTDAPVFQAHFHLSRVDDQQLLEMYQAVMAQEETDVPALPPGPPVVVQDPPKP